MIEAQVVAVGQEAVGEDKLLILFNETATAALKQYSVIQKIADEPIFDLKKEDTITFDEQTYTITHVGSMANRNLTDIGHVTLVFDEIPEEDLIANGIYLNPAVVPNIKEGTIIRYR